MNFPLLKTCNEYVESIRTEDIIGIPSFEKIQLHIDINTPTILSKPVPNISKRTGNMPPIEFHTSKELDTFKLQISGEKGGAHFNWNDFFGYFIIPKKGIMASSILFQETMDFVSEFQRLYKKKSICTTSNSETLYRFGLSSEESNEIKFDRNKQTLIVTQFNMDSVNENDLLEIATNHKNFKKTLCLAKHCIGFVELTIENLEVPIKQDDKKKLKTTTEDDELKKLMAGILTSSSSVEKNYVIDFGVVRYTDEKNVKKLMSSVFEYLKHDKEFNNKLGIKISFENNTELQNAFWLKPLVSFFGFRYPEPFYSKTDAPLPEYMVGAVLRSSNNSNTMRECVGTVGIFYGLRAIKYKAIENLEVKDWCVPKSSIEYLKKNFKQGMKHFIDEFHAAGKKKLYYDKKKHFDKNNVISSISEYHKLSTKSKKHTFKLLSKKSNIPELEDWIAVVEDDSIVTHFVISMTDEDVTRIKLTDEFSLFLEMLKTAARIEDLKGESECEVVTYIINSIEELNSTRATMSLLIQNSKRFNPRIGEFIEDYFKIYASFFGLADFYIYE